MYNYNLGKNLRLIYQRSDALKVGEEHDDSRYFQ